MASPCIMKHLRAPLMLITGDRNLEMLARYEENAHLLAILKHFGHEASLFELEGFDHVNVLSPACLLIRRDIAVYKSKDYQY